MIDLQQLSLGTIARKFVLYRCIKEIEIFEQQWNLLSDICQNLITSIYVKVQLNVKFHAIPSISFCTSAATKLVSHTDTQTFC